MTFKNALCLAPDPEAGGGYKSDYWYRCHRHNDHKPPHRSRAFEWNDGDRESKPRVPAQTEEGSEP